MNFVNLLSQGPLAYDYGLALQEKLHRARREGSIADTILFLEHKPVFTLGTRGEAADILLPRAECQARGIDVVQVARGGQVTYHGPGQLVVYCILDLGRDVRSVRNLVHGLEKAVLALLLETYGLKASTEVENPGIWLPEGKVAALGISIKDRVSMHGLALNIHTNMSDFSLIVPCGIRDRKPVRLADLVLNPPSLDECAVQLVPHFVRELAIPEWSYSKELLAGI